MLVPSDDDVGRAARLGTIGLVAQAAAGVALLAAALTSGSFVAIAAAVHVLAGAAAWAAGLALAARRSRAKRVRDEAARIAQAEARAGRERLFAPEVEAEEKALATFEQRARPALGVAFAALEVACGVALIAWARARLVVPAPEHLLGAASAFAAVAFTMLLLARYALALARGAGTWVGGARRAASAAAVSLGAAVALALRETAPSLDLDPLGHALAAIEVLLGVEVVLALLLEAYRPRRKGEAPRLAFESRLLVLLSEPGDIARSLARAADYQFGFEISTTWSYQLLSRAVPPLVLLGAAAFWLLTTLVVVPAHQRGVVERFGKRRGAVLEPGLHAKLPWPVDVARLIDVERVRDVVIGGRDDDEKKDQARFPVIAWTKAHAAGKDEPLLLVARKDEGRAGDAPVSLLAARIPVRWRVADVDAFVSAASDPEKVLEQIASREIGFLACGIDMAQALGPGRDALARELRERIDAAARKRGLGIEVLEVGLEDVHPPAEVAQAWESETAALEGREARRLAGVKEAATKVPEARAQADARRARAKSKADARAVIAKAEAERFVALRELAKAAPRAFRNDRLLAALEEATEKAKKVIVGDESALDVDLQDRESAASIDDAKVAQEAGSHR